MNQKDFFKQLGAGLTPLPRQERKRILDYYGELYNDKLETGATEEEAVESFGSPEALVVELLEGEGRPVKMPKNLSSASKTGIIVAIVLSSPIWAPILISVLAVIFTLLVCVWAVIISLAASAVSLCLGGIAELFIFPLTSWHLGFLAIAANSALCVLCVGLGLLLAVGTWELGKLSVRLSVFTWKQVKKLFSKELWIR